MCHVSCTTCHLSGLAFFEAMLGKTVFKLKPLEARNASDGTNTQTDTTTDIATSSLNLPMGKFRENVY